MARRKLNITNRAKILDYKYSSFLIGKFINSIMLDGKKSIAEKIVYSALDLGVSRVGSDSVEGFFDIVLEKVTPLVEVRSRRVGGATYQVPVEVSANRGRSLAFRWLIRAARSRNSQDMVRRLSNELIDAYNGVGSAVKVREEKFKMAQANKAFAHYRW